MNLDSYPPLARKAMIFLKSAVVLNKPNNRGVGLWESSYYLLSHALELSIKSYVLKSTENYSEKTHDIELLSQKYRTVCSFTDNEMDNIRKLRLLNSGSGGLRYNNTIFAEFLPSTFFNGVKIVERLLKKFKNDIYTKQSVSLK